MLGCYVDQKVSDSKDDELIGTAVHGQAPQGQSWNPGLTEAAKIRKRLHTFPPAAAPWSLCNPELHSNPSSFLTPTNYFPYFFPFIGKILSTLPLCNREEVAKFALDSKDHPVLSFLFTQTVAVMSP